MEVVNTPSVTHRPIQTCRINSSFETTAPARSLRQTSSAITVGSRRISRPAQVMRLCSGSTCHSPRVEFRLDLPFSEVEAIRHVVFSFYPARLTHPSLEETCA
jgi:hypothetical protein